MTGRYYEQLQAGQVIHHQTSRTVTEMDNVLYCALTMNPQPLHLDQEFARGTHYGRIVVNGLYTLGLMMGLTVYDTTLGTTGGNLGFESICFASPVFVGDTMTAETEVISKRVSSRRPNFGVVTFEHRCRNQQDEVVLSCRRAGLIQRKPAESSA